MPVLFRVYTRVQLEFSAYAIKMIKKYIKIPYFQAGLMVTQVVQPPQHVANCFQLIETTLREYKSPSCAWPKGERKIIDIILCWSPNSSLISHASCTSQVFTGNPCFLEMFITLYVISCAQFLEVS